MPSRVGWWCTEALLRRLTGAEGALLVNNNAGAVLLALAALAGCLRILSERFPLLMS